MAEQINNDSLPQVREMVAKKSDFNKVAVFKKAKQQWDSLQGAIVELQKDSALVVTKIESLEKHNAPLYAKVEQLETDIGNLQTQLVSCKNECSAKGWLNTPVGYSSLTLLIISLTIIIIKKGLSLKKGNTSISFGDKK